MKNFNELTELEQKQAVAFFTNRLLNWILDGAIRFNDDLNGDNLQKRIDRAIKRSEEMQTPWFAKEYILDTCRDDIESMARCEAEDVEYDDAKNEVVDLAMIRKINL